MQFLVNTWWFFKVNDIVIFVNLFRSCKTTSRWRNHEVLYTDWEFGSHPHKGVFLTVFKFLQVSLPDSLQVSVSSNPIHHALLIEQWKYVKIVQLLITQLFSHTLVFTYFEFLNFLVCENSFDFNYMAIFTYMWKYVIFKYVKIGPAKKYYYWRIAICSVYLTLSDKTLYIVWGNFRCFTSIL